MPPSLAELCAEAGARNVGSALAQCWASVADAGQHWANPELIQHVYKASVIGLTLFARYIIISYMSCMENSRSGYILKFGDRVFSFAENWTFNVFDNLTTVPDYIRFFHFLYGH